MAEPPLSPDDFSHDVTGTAGTPPERLAVTHLAAAPPYLTGPGAAPEPPTAVLLHGAGSGSKERLRPLLAEFAGRGCGALAFDFSGHGGSSGELRELSLRRRFAQAVDVIDARVPAGSPLILVGFSMSGQTVADLAGHYGDRVAALALCAPAVYAADAWNLPFDDGDGPFTRLIRTPGSWRTSPALDALRRYAGRAVLAVPGADAIIPGAVTDAVQDALAARAQFTRLELPDADHFLGAWFRDHADARRELVTAVLDGYGDGGWTATRAWLRTQLPEGRQVTGTRALRGGFSSQLRALTLDDGNLDDGTGEADGDGGGNGSRDGHSHGNRDGHGNGNGHGGGLVLRTFVKPFFRRHAPGLLAREASVLGLLAGRPDIPAPELIAVDPAAERCDHPSLLMTLLPGRVRIDHAGAPELERRTELLAGLLARIHAVVPDERPRPYQAWTSPERVTAAPGALWERAVDVIRAEPPAYEGCFLHRDFHPGNVLFEGAGARTRISGVVDWVETSWGPADLDVAHCSTALALLYGPEHGLAFADRYTAQGGRPLADGPDQLYWRLLDALAHTPDAAKLAGPWRELGRTDLTAEVLGERLEGYVRGGVERYA
ncbi:alpha/beta fold hydrolase [Streptomyces sp. NPDC056716]|uniref:alpha/beta fold hydrolase n=1 Tax=unclassified Streptomyces TaxID=2593676 RepID=UPI0036A9E992